MIVHRKKYYNEKKYFYLIFNFKIIYLIIRDHENGLRGLLVMQHTMSFNNMKILSRINLQEKILRYSIKFILIDFRNVLSFRDNVLNLSFLTWPKIKCTMLRNISIAKILLLTKKINSNAFSNQ